MMEATFTSAKAFNQPGISAWDISKVSAMTQMFDDSALASDECSKQEMYEAWSDVAAFTSAHDWSSAVCTEPAAATAAGRARPISMNPSTGLYGCAGAVYGNGSPSEGYCKGVHATKDLSWYAAFGMPRWGSAPRFESPHAAVAAHLPGCRRRRQERSLQGHNDQRLTDVSIYECKLACCNSVAEYGFECLSFDYYKNTKKCDLSSESEFTMPGDMSANGSNTYAHFVDPVAPPSTPPSPPPSPPPPTQPPPSPPPPSPPPPSRRRRRRRRRRRPRPRRSPCSNRRSLSGLDTATVVGIAVAAAVAAAVAVGCVLGAALQADRAAEARGSRRRGWAAGRSQTAMGCTARVLRRFRLALQGGGGLRRAVPQGPARADARRARVYPTRSTSSTSRPSSKAFPTASCSSARPAC